MSFKIDTVSARSRLSPRTNPYFTRIRTYCYLGYRVSVTASAGNWVARYIPPGSQKGTYYTLGKLEDVQSVHRFDVAKEKAEEWFNTLTNGEVIGPKTVSDACEEYLQFLRSRGKPQSTIYDVERRFRTYVLNASSFSSMELAHLKPNDLKSWRLERSETPVCGAKGKCRARKPDTLNRDMTPLRAALNLAYENGWVASDFAWRTSLKPINRNDNPSVDVARDVYLAPQDRKRLIEFMPPDFGPFIRLMCLLPLRPGSIAKLKIQDFDANQRWLWIAEDKNAKRRKIPLSPSAHQLLMHVSRNKPNESHIFLTRFGKPWNKDLWKKYIKQAVAELGLPSKTVLYSVRHSVITDLVQANVPVVSIAKLSGTSVRMIEKYYAKLVPDFAVDALESLNI